VEIQDRPQTGPEQFATGARLRQPSGELGEWLFQVAIATAIARAEDRVPALPGRQP
jgi:hypothetical protein